jgi:hypothetical protein
MQSGFTLFNKVGCALCHSPSLATVASVFTDTGGVTYQSTRISRSPYGLGSVGWHQLRDGGCQVSPVTTFCSGSYPGLTVGHPFPGIALYPDRTTKRLKVIGSKNAAAAVGNSAP